MSKSTKAPVRGSDASNYKNFTEGKTFSDITMAGFECNSNFNQYTLILNFKKKAKLRLAYFLKFKHV